MLQQEFTKRVGLEVSAQEYAHIEQVYMASDLDKDEFCKQWVKMNKERIDGWTGHRVLDRKSVSSVIYEVKMYLGAVA